MNGQAIPVPREVDDTSEGKGTGYSQISPDGSISGLSDLSIIPLLACASHLHRAQRGLSVFQRSAVALVSSLGQKGDCTRGSPFFCPGLERLIFGLVATSF